MKVLANNAKPRASWNAIQDTSLLDKLVACKRDTLNADGSIFKPSAWALVADLFNKKFSIIYEKQQLKGHYRIVYGNAAIFIPLLTILNSTTL